MNMVIALLAFVLMAGLGNAQDLVDSKHSISFEARELTDGMVTATLQYLDLNGRVISDEIISLEVRNGIGTIQLSASQVTGRSLGSLRILIEGKESYVAFANIHAPYAYSVVDSSITSSKIAADYLQHVLVDGKSVSNGLSITGKSNVQISHDKSSSSILIGSGSITTLALGDDWVYGGNAPGSGTNEFVGTTNSSAHLIFTLKSQNQEVVRFEPSATNGLTYPNIFGGGSSNFRELGTAASGSSILGGKNNTTSGNYTVTLGGTENAKLGSYTTVLGGRAFTSGNTPPQYGSAGGGQASSPLGDHSTVGGGNNNFAFGEFNAAFGGHGNNTAGIGSFVGGGGSIEHGVGFPGHPERNIASSSFSTVGAGELNMLYQPYSFVGGGRSNGTHNYPSSGISAVVVLGGASNRVMGDKAFIGGGLANNMSATLTGSFAVLGGGYLNKTNSNFGVIFGGADPASGGTDPNNHIRQGLYSVIGTGTLNLIEGAYSTILGGQSQKVGDASSAESGNPTHVMVGGGELNRVAASHSIILGGKSNAIENTFDQYSSVLGGESNVISGYDHISNSAYSSIAGGQNNGLRIWSEYSSALGGATNTSYSSYTAIGGKSNYISSSSSYSLVAGGESNYLADNPYAVIAGGKYTSVDASDGGTILGGYNIQIRDADASFIGGGSELEIGDNTNLYGNANHSTLLGGWCNHIVFNDMIEAGVYTKPPGYHIAQYGALAGGSCNEIYGHYNALNGGYYNRGHGIFASTLGVQNIAQDFQTVIGYNGFGFDLRMNNSENRDQSTSISGPLNSDPIFLVGMPNFARPLNERWRANNGFMVTQAGYSVVATRNWDNRQSNQPVPSLKGGTFTDNVTYIWAQIPALDPGPLYTPAQLGNNVFGIATVEVIAAGHYRITPAHTVPQMIQGESTSPTNFFEQISAVATLNGDHGAPAPILQMITTTRVPNTNFIDIRTFEFEFDDVTQPMPDECNLKKLGFTLIVTGRPTPAILN